MLMLKFIPFLLLHLESSIPLKEERIAVDEDHKSALPEASLACQNRDKTKSSGPNRKLVHAAPGDEVSTSRKSILGRELANDTNNLFELKEQLPSSDRMWKRKRKPIGSKVRTVFSFNVLSNA